MSEIYTSSIKKQVCFVIKTDVEKPENMESTCKAFHGIDNCLNGASRGVAY